MAYEWIGISLLIASIFGGDPAQEQAEPKTRDLTGRAVSAQELIEVLKPISGMERRGGARSLKTRAVGVEPKCDGYRTQQKRGIGFEPVADVAAVEIQFAFDSDEISPQAANNLNAMGQAFKSDELSTYCFLLQGHTDSIGSDHYNQELSERRAGSVARYLADRLGVDRRRLLTRGYGESNPLDSNDTDAGRQRNRRVEIMNLGQGE